ncbi:signal peptidase I [Salinispirillum sp. LH 10-3-1]|uniref:Signal peptidase I n=1 Tax=Salinispirillum sp. LH 10-3-1 TaxID=2952525 RepID=A0AB38YEE1_9GAMM
MFGWIAWLLAALIVVWLVDTFVLDRRRLKTLSALLKSGEVSAQNIESYLTQRMWSRLAMMAGAPLIIFLIFTAIRENKDLALLLILGTLFAGLVALADRLLLRKLRLNVAEQLPTEALQAQAQTDNGLVEYAKSFFPVLALVVVLRSFLFEPYQIPSGSMRPNLIVGDFLLVNKFSYGFRLPVVKTQLTDFGAPQPGDIMVFTPPHQTYQNYIKRVVGVGGDRIQYDYRTKELRVNGELVPRRYLDTYVENGRRIARYIETLGGKEYEIYQIQNMSTPNLMPLDVIVPDGHFFVVGDNRDDSLDSRFWQQQYGTSPFVERREVQGKAVVRWMYWPSLLSLPSFSRAGSLN